jgi:hypothetical protein
VARQRALVAALQSGALTRDDFVRAYDAVKPPPGPSIAVFRIGG